MLSAERKDKLPCCVCVEGTGEREKKKRDGKLPFLVGLRDSWLWGSLRHNRSWWDWFGHDGY